MSETTALHAYIHARFNEAFGEPKEISEDNARWSLKREAGPLTINVLLNGSREGPALWVFDPHDPEHGIVSALLTRPEEVDRAVETIRQRLAGSYGGDFTGWTDQRARGGSTS